MQTPTGPPPQRPRKRQGVRFGALLTALLSALLGLLSLFGLGGCTTLAPYSNAAFNQPLAAAAPASGPPPRHSFAVDGQRGNPKVLMFLALSGGGSRAAYLSSATMLALQSLQASLGADLLAEVDVMSSVSGGSIAAAYYAASRDAALADPRLLARLAPVLAAQPVPLPALGVDGGGRLVCSAALSADDSARLRTLLGAGPLDADVIHVEQLCQAASFPPWDRDAVLETMRTDYIKLWIANWFWPANALRYWTSSFDRSDIMAQTLAHNIYARRGVTHLLDSELTLADLNPSRPYLIVNATNASSQARDHGQLDEFPFGSVFTFTREDFADRLRSDADSYSLARTVMGSSAFPLVFASMTLQDFRQPMPPLCPPTGPTSAEPCHSERYLHIFDGGNSDNLGLRSVKRALLQLEVDGRLQPYDRIIVLLVDAFTTPRGAARDKPDPRSLISLLLDTNVSDAVDSLLQINRNALLAEFDEGQLGWSRECGATTDGLRQLPIRLCEALNRTDSSRVLSVSGDRPGQRLSVLDLTDRLVFYHFGFDDVVPFAASRAEGVDLKQRLDQIPTSFQIAADATALIDQAVALVISPRNPCMQALAGLVRQPGPVASSQVTMAQADCKASESGRVITPVAK